MKYESIDKPGTILKGEGSQPDFSASLTEERRVSRSGFFLFFTRLMGVASQS